MRGTNPAKLNSKFTKSRRAGSLTHFSAWSSVLYRQHVPQLRASTSRFVARDQQAMSTSGTSTPGAGPSVPKDQMDLYRPLAKDIQKSTTPYAQSSDTPQLTDLLSLDVNAYAHRLANKSLFLAESAPEASGSSLVKGKKRNRGSDSAKKAARDEVEGRRAEMEKDGLVGLRRVKKRLGGVVKRGSRIEYHTLIPLNHLHTQYLINLFALPPLPSIQASLDTTTASSRPVSSSTRTQASVPGWPKSVPSIDSISSKLLKADFTGISLKVISSRNASLVGIYGVVVEETASTFALISSDDKVRVVPKDGTQFEVRIPLYAPAQQTTSTVESEGPNAQDDLDDRPQPIDMAAHIADSPSFLITLLGSNFCFRSGERAGRKFKLAQETGGGNGWGEGWVRGPWSEVLDAMEPQSSRQSGLGKKSHQASGEGHPIDSLNDAGAITKSPSVRRKKGKSRRKDPVPGGSLEVFF